MDGFVLSNDKAKGIRKDTFCAYWILRKEPRDGAIVVVGIGHIVRVELELAIIEVEDGSLRKDAIRIRSFTTFHPSHKPRNMIFHMNHNSVFYSVTRLLACFKKR